MKFTMHRFYYAINIAAIFLCLSGCGMLDDYAKRELEKISSERAAKEPSNSLHQASGYIVVDQYLFPQTNPPRLYMVDDLSEKSKALFARSAEILSRILKEANGGVSHLEGTQETLIKAELKKMMDMKFPEPLTLKLNVNGQDYSFDSDQRAIDSYYEHMSKIPSNSPMGMIAAIKDSLEQQILQLKGKALQPMPEDLVLKEQSNIKKARKQVVTFFGIELENAGIMKQEIHDILGARANLQWAESLYHEIMNLEDRLELVFKGQANSDIDMTRLRAFAEWKAFRKAYIRQIEIALKDKYGLESRTNSSFSIQGKGRLVARLEFSGEAFYVLEDAEDLNAFKKVRRLKL